MPVFQEIEDVKELGSLSKELTRKISGQAVLHKTKTIGYPSGRFDTRVHFAESKGDNVLWWAGHSSSDGEASINLVGRGDPRGSDYLLIDLQFNVPIRSSRRSHGGAFVRDVESGIIYLAHRGIVTRGKSRVKKDLLLAETSATTTQVHGSKGLIELFLVAAVESDSLLDDISTFAQEIRRAAAVVTDEDVTGDAKETTVSNENDLDDTLGEYFEEFSGSRRLPAREEAVVLVRHGGVVHQLADAVKHLGSLHKSKLVDLAVVSDDCVYLFEVKTSIDTTSIYIAIGQLCVHALPIAKLFGVKNVRKIMVIPGVPSSRIRDGLFKDTGIEILSYDWAGKNRSSIAFDPNSLTT